MTTQNVDQNVFSRWSSDKSRDLYGIQNWSNGYFDISEDGNVVIKIAVEGGYSEVSIAEVIAGIKERGSEMPVLLRIENILDGQISLLNESFRNAIAAYNYKGEYRGVFPVKVNQQQGVIEEITRFGVRYHHGLEVGSKAELIAAIAMLKDRESCLVCNGYKDSKFFDLGLYATKLGYQCFFVLERLRELPLLLKRSKILGIRPAIGLRLKPNTTAGGNWGESGGPKSLFGLTTNEILEVVEILKTEDMLDCLKLLHIHLGSQIPNIRDIRTGLTEAVRIYTSLVEEGAAMGFLDIGGGLAVDYDGSSTNSPSSCNYSIAEYCNDIVEIVMGLVDEKEIQHPTIISESGRATVAYHSVLLFNVLDVASPTELKLPDSLPEESHEMINNLWSAYKEMTVKNIQECYNDVVYYRDEIHQLFRLGQIGLRERALGDTIFWNVIQSIAVQVRKLKKPPVALENLEGALSDIYYANFSIFQSLPDSWAIGQLFPILPIHRLTEAPAYQAVLGDITCDSDGKIDRFIDLYDINRSLALHKVKHDEDYYLGVFLVGAYQETLGDLHNLMGDTNIVSIRINENGSYDFVKETEGDSVADVLSYMEYDPKDLLTQFRETAEIAVKENRINPGERRLILGAYEEGLRSYTYYTEDE